MAIFSNCLFSLKNKKNKCLNCFSSAVPCASMISSFSQSQKFQVILSVPLRVSFVPPLYAPNVSFFVFLPFFSKSRAVRHLTLLRTWAHGLLHWLIDGGVTWLQIKWNEFFFTTRVKNGIRLSSALLCSGDRILGHVYWIRHSSCSRGAVHPYWYTYSGFRMCFEIQMEIYVVLKS